MTTQTTQQRINQLIKADDQSANVIRGYYQEALDHIKNHLMQFYIRYADATGLSVQQVKGRVNQWDIMQFKQAIDRLDEATTKMSTDDREEFNQRRKIAVVEGSSTQRKQLLMGIVAVVVLTATVKANKHLRDRLSMDVKDEIKYLGLSRAQKRELLAYTDDYTANLSGSVWEASDSLNYALHDLVNKKISGKGITSADLQKLFPYLKPTGNKAGTVTSAVHSAEYKVTRAMRWWSSRETDEIAMATFKQRGVVQVNIVNEPGACQTCAAIADDGPYYLSDCPDLPIHNNCRCHKEAYRVSLSSLI